MRSLILVVLLTAEALAQSDPGSLVAARQLYASADYVGALDMLDRLVAANPSPQERPSIDLYRTLCFVALGRAAEADEALAAMIARDPLYRPADAEIPPRLRSMFSEKRRAVLPAIIQTKYGGAKAAFDRSDYKAATEGFTAALMMLSDPDIEASSRQRPLSDLRVLASSFNDLSVRALTPHVPPEPQSTTPPSPVPTVRAPQVAKIYDSHDADVVAPVTVKQDMPRFTRPVPVERTGVLFIVIDETGSVESAIITEPLERTYDAMLLAAAKTWSYQPAMRNGVAVKYRKRIQLTLPRQTN